MSARAARLGTAPARPVPPRPERAGHPRAPLTLVPPVPRRTGRTSFVLLIATLLSAGLAALLGLNTALAQGSFATGDLQRQVAELDDRAQSLEEDLARAGAPARLARAAAGIGMAPAPGVGFVSLTEGRVVAKADAAPGVPPPLTEAERLELEQRRAEAAAAAAAAAERARIEEEQAAAERAAARERRRAEVERRAAERAAAAAEAERQRAEQQWRDQLAGQEKAGPRSGGEQLVDPPS